MASEEGHVKTFSAALGSGFVDLDGKAYPFDASALPEDMEAVRSGDLVEVVVKGGTVRAVKLAGEREDYGADATSEEEMDLDSASRVTLKALGKTPARFRMDTFKKNARRLDFK